jgi:hypothetical protein
MSVLLDYQEEPGMSCQGLRCSPAAHGCPSAACAGQKRFAKWIEATTGHIAKSDRPNYHHSDVGTTLGGGYMPDAGGRH